MRENLNSPAPVSLFKRRYWCHSTILARLTEWDWFKRGSDGMRLFKYWSEKGGRKRGQFLILFTPRPASSGDPRDGSDNRACPSPDARRSTPPSSSSPPAGAPLKPTSLNPHLDRVLRSASCHRPSFNSVAMISSASASAVFSDGVKTNKTCRCRNH